jgi:hypothetical protein
MYARGAMPETARPPEAVVRWLPAAMPATCVPCDELSPSNASGAVGALAPGGGNALATMTFAFVYRTCPFGKPEGIA